MYLQLMMKIATTIAMLTITTSTIRMILVAESLFFFFRDLFFATGKGIDVGLHAMNYNHENFMVMSWILRRLHQEMRGGCQTAACAAVIGSAE